MMQPPPPRPPPPTSSDGLLLEDDAAAPPPGPTSAIVFQCASCRRAIGDSLALVNADEELRNITLHGACGIVRSPCTRTAEAGKDQGSTYHELFCQGCNAPLGRVYLTTAPALDPLRNLFTFDTDALESYELGRYDHVLDLPEHLKPPPPMVLGGGGAAAAAAGAGVVEGAATAPEVQMELTKLQNMMLVFHDRISTLEKALKKAHASSSSGSSGSSSGSGHGGRKSIPTSSSSSLNALADENSPPPVVSGSNKRKKQR